MKSGFVYILSNVSNKVLYIGVTSDLEHRIRQHKEKQIKCFTQKYNVTKLVYYEEYNNMMDAIVREKQMKVWKRQWKENLIKGINPDFEDLSIEFFDKL